MRGIRARSARSAPAQGDCVSLLNPVTRPLGAVSFARAERPSLQRSICDNDARPRTWTTCATVPSARSIPVSRGFKKPCVDVPNTLCIPVGGSCSLAPVAVGRRTWPHPLRTSAWRAAPRSSLLVLQICLTSCAPPCPRPQGTPGSSSGYARWSCSLSMTWEQTPPRLGPPKSSCKFSMPAQTAHFPQSSPPSRKNSRGWTIGSVRG